MELGRDAVSVRAARNPIAALGDLAVYPAVYLAASVWLFSLAAGTTLDQPIPYIVAILGLGLYLLDRVKLQEGWLDPADLRGQPARHGFVRRHSGTVRLLAFTCLVLSGVGLIVFEPQLLFVVPLGVAAVLVYAFAGPKRRRLKDLPLIKPLLIGIGITLLAVFAGGEGHAGLVLPVIFLLLVTTGDAAACDIEDHHTDRRFGTRTPAAILGSRRGWLLPVACHAGAVVTSLAFRGTSAPPIAAALLVTTAGLAAADAETVRDLVDIRLPVLCLLAVIFG